MEMVAGYVLSTPRQYPTRISASRWKFCEPQAHKPASHQEARKQIEMILFHLRCQKLTGLLLALPFKIKHPLFVRNIYIFFKTPSSLLQLYMGYSHTSTVIFHTKCSSGMLSSLGPLAKLLYILHGVKLYRHRGKTRGIRCLRYLSVSSDPRFITLHSTLSFRFRWG